MSQETELDDLDLDKLLDDEDFLEDFELEEVVSGSDSQTAPDFPLEMETAEISGSPAAEPAAPGDDSSAAVNPESPVARPWWQKFIFPAAVFLVVLFLLLQVYAARKIFLPEYSLWLLGPIYIPWPLPACRDQQGARFFVCQVVVPGVADVRLDT